MGPLAVETRGLAKRFESVEAVRSLDLAVREGEMFVARRTGRRGQDDDDPHALRPPAADGGRGHGAGLRPRPAGRGDQEPHRLPVAEIQPLRRPDRRREHRVLRRDPPRPGLPQAPRGAARVHPAHAFPRPPGRAPLGRHAPEAGPGLHARPHAPADIPRRAHDGRRPGLAARLLGHPLGPSQRRGHDRHVHALHGRGRAVRRGSGSSPAGGSSPRIRPRLSRP